MKKPLLRSLRRLFSSPGQAEADILFLLKTHPWQEFTGVDIWKKLGIGVGSSYPALFRLERRKAIESRWREGPYPRMRLYRFKGGQRDG